MASFLMHWHNLKYLLRHKWFVFIECYKLGIPWQGFIHDLSKLRPSEWKAYAEFFFWPGWKWAPGLETPIARRNPQALNRAWLHHVHRNPHHWDYWVLHTRWDQTGSGEIFPMPNKYRCEMLADWRGATRARNGPNAREWYLAHRGKMRLHPETQQWLEQQLGIGG